jgi:hypothetical protein
MDNSVINIMGDEEVGGKKKNFQKLKKLDLGNIESSSRIQAEEGDLAFDSSKLQYRQNLLRK